MFDIVHPNGAIRRPLVGFPLLVYGLCIWTYLVITFVSEMVTTDPLERTTPNTRSPARTAAHWASGGPWPPYSVGATVVTRLVASLGLITAVGSSMDVVYAVN